MARRLPRTRGKRGRFACHPPRLPDGGCRCDTAYRVTSSLGAHDSLHHEVGEIPMWQIVRRSALETKWPGSHDRNEQSRAQHGQVLQGG